MSLQDVDVDMEDPNPDVSLEFCLDRRIFNQLRPNLKKTLEERDPQVSDFSLYAIADLPYEEVKRMFGLTEFEHVEIKGALAATRAQAQAAQGPAPMDVDDEKKVDDFARLVEERVLEKLQYGTEASWKHAIATEMRSRKESEQLLISMMDIKTRSQNRLTVDVPENERFIQLDCDYDGMLDRYRIVLVDELPDGFARAFNNCLSDKEKPEAQPRFNRFASQFSKWIDGDEVEMVEHSSSPNKHRDKTDLSLIAIDVGGDARAYIELKSKGAVIADARFQCFRYGMRGVVDGSRSHCFTVLILGAGRFALCLATYRDGLTKFEVSSTMEVVGDNLAALVYSLAIAPLASVGIHKNVGEIVLVKSLGEGAEKYVLTGAIPNEPHCAVKFWKDRERYTDSKALHESLKFQYGDEEHCLDVPKRWITERMAAVFKRRLNYRANIPVSKYKQFAAELSVVHDENLVHCDVSPQNLLVDYESMKLVLTDCGSMRLARDDDGDGDDDVMNGAPDMAVMTRADLFPEEYVQSKNNRIDKGVDQIMFLRTLQEIHRQGPNYGGEWISESKLTDAMAGNDFVELVGRVAEKCARLVFNAREGDSAVVKDGLPVAKPQPKSSTSSRRSSRNNGFHIFNAEVPRS